MEIGVFDHLIFFIIGVFLPTLNIISEKSQMKEVDLDSFGLPPKKHIYYSNGLVLIIGALIVFTLWNLSGRSFELLGVCLPTINSSSLFFTGLTIFVYAADTLVSYLNYNKEKDTSSMKDLSLIMPSTWQDFRHFIFLAFAAGICEEIVYRGFLVNYFLQLFFPNPYALYIALILPSLIFAISHIYQGWYNVVKIFAISILFGAVFIYSKSLVLVIIIHVLVDLISGFLMVVIAKREEKNVNSK